MTDPGTFWAMYREFYGHESVDAFQAFAGLRVTGQLDPATMDVLHTPRCGVSDVQRATADAKWRKKRLTYSVQSRVPNIDPATVDDILKAAWASWEAAADLKFTRVEAGQADLIISTGRGSRAGFDGPGGTLAWAQLPSGNDQPLLMRFDVDERWNTEIMLLNVAAHEFGHLIGLDHDAQNSGSLMAPFYSRRIATPQANDIRRAQAYYGPPTTLPPQPPSPRGKTVITLECDGVVTGARVLSVQAA